MDAYNLTYCSRTGKLCHENATIATNNESMKRWALLGIVFVGLCGLVESYSKGAAPGIGPKAATLEEPVPAPAQAKARALSSGDAAALVTLVLFLGLIGGMLMRWSSDTSAKAERSVFAASVVSDPLIK